MIIEKIELDNFMCYSGERNFFEFSEGINVVIGDNGYGKSKLYDAFYWCMYDNVFNSQRKEFQSTKVVKAGLISDKAIAEAANGRVTTSVKITFRNTERNNVFILARHYSVTKVENGILEDNDSEFTIMEKELAYLTARMVTDEDRKRSILNSILPSQIKDYLWFQGEQVESIIDFNKQDTLTRAVNVLSNISRYDGIISIARAAAKTAATEYDREIKRLSKDTVKSAELEAKKLAIEEQLESNLREEKEISDNLSRAESRCEELLNKQADATKVNFLQARRIGSINLLSELNSSQKSEEISFHRKMFRNKWVLKGTEDLQRLYAKKFSTYERQRLRMEEEERMKRNADSDAAEKLQTRLPINVPEPNYVEWMLEQEHCLVCDRAAKKNTEEWLKIQSLLHRKTEKATSIKKAQLTLHDFSDDFKRLYQVGLSLSNRISEVDDDINEALEKKTNLRRRIGEVTRELESVDNQIEKLLADSSLNVEQAQDILNEYNIQNKKAKDFKDDLTRVSQRIEHLRSNLKVVKDQLESLVTGDISSLLIEKRNVTADFEDLSKSTRDRVFNQLISQLENEANHHYQAMTSGNRSTRGRIKLRKLPNGNFMPEIIDGNGNPLLGVNTSNLILVKLSAIMAIISAKGNSGEIYTLITDAPTSVFGEDYTIGFCKTVSKVYRQSIIMSKEFYKNQDLRSELLTNSDIKIGRVYTITPSVLETERLDRTALSTKIQALN